MYGVYIYAVIRCGSGKDRPEGSLYKHRPDEPKKMIDYLTYILTRKRQAGFCYTTCPIVYMYLITH